MSRPVTRKLCETSIRRAAKRLAKSDGALANVLAEFGTPPLWKRPANFATLVRIILEQQVSLASAKSTYEKLRSACGGRVTAQKLAALERDGLRSIGFSRQKTRYALALAEDVITKRFVVGRLARMSDQQATKAITERLGLGAWSAEVYLMMALLRPDVFPVGDLAIVKGIEMMDGRTYDSPEEILQRTDPWRPYRSVAARMIWQLYLGAKSSA